MSHNIQELDKIVSLKPCWHRLEDIVEEINFENSGLDWKITPRPVFADFGERRVDIPDYYALATDGGHVIDVKKDSYYVIQNSRVWECLQNALQGIDYEVVTTGSLGNLRKIFIAIELKDSQKYVVNGDEFQNHLVFCSSHDGSQHFEARDTSIRVVCENTLQAVRGHNGKLNLKVRHTKNAEIRIENMEQEIERLFEKREEFYKSFEWLSTVPMSLQEAEKLLVGFETPETADKEISTRTLNKVRKELELFTGGIGNKGETRYDYMNGISEYYTRHASKNVSRAFGSSEFGVGAQRKSEMFDILLDDEKLNQLTKRGEELLKENQLALV